jgi:hypothetical protein
MGKRQEVIVGKAVFESKAKVTERCREMLKRYRNGQTINEQDSEFLSGLLERHPEAREKIGVGVKRFFKDPGPTRFTTDCFWLERKDGSKIDFSFKTCVAGK